MNFKLLGKTIEISDGSKNYMKVLSDYKKLSAKAQNEFFAEYDKYISAFLYDASDAHNLLTHFSDDAMDRYVKKYVTETRKYLASYEVYTLSDAEIWDEITKENSGQSELQTSFNKFCLDAIVEAKEYDEDDEFLAKKLKEKFMSRYFEKQLNLDIMGLCDYVHNYLDDNGIVDIDFVYKEDAQKAMTIYKNLQDSNIPSDKKAEFAFSMIELDPTEKWYYEYIFHKLPQAKYEIVAIAKYLHIDLSNQIDGYLLDKYRFSSFNREEDALKMMDELRLEITNLGHKSDVSESLQKDLRKILTDFDVKARTYEGILFNTREECAKAKNDDLELKNLCGNVKELDKKACHDFIAQIKNKQCDEKIKLKHITILNDRIAEYDNEYLENLVSNIESCQEDECNKITTQINDYDASQSLKDSFLSRVEMRIHLIWDAEDFERFTDIYINTQAGNDKQIADNHKLISDTGRTGCKAQFLKALSALNDSNIEVAAKYAMAKEGGFFSSMINMGKKDTYETLTLEGKVIHPAITEKIDELKNEKPKGLFGGIKKSLFGGFGSSKKAEEPVQVSSKPKFCPECGEKLTDNVKFCPNCGKRLD